MASSNRSSRAADATAQLTEVKCAFCGGKGLDPFGIMSPLAECQVCEGEGSVKLAEPMVKCAFCHGTGVHPNSRMTCTVCGGVGTVEVQKNASTCKHCHGTGRTADCEDCHFPESVFPCQHCKGTGVMVEQ